MSLFDPIRILVIHGDPVAQAGLSVAFASYKDFDVQTRPDSAGAAVAPLLTQRRWSTDIIVSDYANGVTLASQFARLGNLGNLPRVVVVAGIDREWEIRSALEHGVRGYLLVGIALDDLAAGVRAVHRGARYLSPQVAARLAESIALEPLTMREEEVLRLVVEGYCNKEVGRRLGIAVGTVKSHLKSIFGKLDVESRTQAVAAVERRGLLGKSRVNSRVEVNVETVARTATFGVASGSSNRRQGSYAAVPQSPA